ncbi:MAG: hypothetical protein WCI73_08525, partial [Phycisphaerae bacterium]
LAVVARAENALTLTEIPAGHTLFVKAPTLEILKQETQPTVVFAAGAGYEFVWTGQTADGTRYFTLATAYYYWNERTPTVKPMWVLFNAPKGLDLKVHARLTAVLDAKGDANKPVLSRDGDRVAAAVVAAVHPRNGTLYQLSVDNKGCDGILHDETRVFILHDRNHGWRFVGTVAANLLIDGDGIDYHESRQVTTEVSWTGVAEAPVRIVCHIAADYKFDQPLTRVSGRYTLAGSLPLRSRDAQYELTIQKGNTLGGLAKILADWRRNHDDSYDDCHDMAAEIRLGIMTLNPGLKPNILRAGTKLAIPGIYHGELMPASGRSGG